MVLFDRLDMVFLLVFYTPKTHRFEIFDFGNVMTLNTGLGVRQGH